MHSTRGVVVDPRPTMLTIVLVYQSVGNAEVYEEGGEDEGFFCTV